MIDDSLCPGRLVVSKAGRDKGKLYVIIRPLDDRSVLIADGEHHRVTKPKRKNVRHLIILDQVDRDLCDWLGREQTISDDRIVTALRAYRPRCEKGGKPLHG